MSSVLHSCNVKTQICITRPQCVKWILFETRKPLCRDFVPFSDKRMPRKPAAYEKRLHNLEMEREKKWLKMLRNWNQFSASDKLRRRIYKGIPEKLRGQVWSRLLNIETVREEQQGKYEVRTKQNGVIQTCHCSRSKSLPSSFVACHLKIHVNDIFLTALSFKCPFAMTSLHRYPATNSLCSPVHHKLLKLLCFWVGCF